MVSLLRGCSGGVLRQVFLEAIVTGFSEPNCLVVQSAVGISLEITINKAGHPFHTPRFRSYLPRISGSFCFPPTVL